MMDLIEAYYAVAADLRRQANLLNNSAELLEKGADQMSEQRIAATVAMNRALDAERSADQAEGSNRE